MSPSLTRVWLEAKSLSLPLVAYWSSALLGLLLFTAVLLGTKGMDADGGAALAGCWAASVGGLLAGQALALLQIRPSWVLGGSVAAWFLSWMVFFGTIAATLNAPGNGPFVIAGLVVLLLAPFFVACGFWSLAPGTGVLATFAPVVWLTGAILVYSEQSGDNAAWAQGSKHAIWSVVTAPILGVGIALVLVYLASRELRRLHRWRFSPRGPDLTFGVIDPKFSVGRASPGCGGLVMLALLALFLTVTSALVAPYFWGTGPAKEGDDPGTSWSDEPGEGSPGQDQPGEPSPGKGPGGMSGPAKEAVRQAGMSLLLLLMMLVLSLLGLLVFGPPLRRVLLLQYLRRPFWPVTPTRRVRQHWRLVEVALGDAGYHRRPGDSAESLAKRAVGGLDLIDPESLVRCAEVADRIVHGIGVMPQDVMMARRTAEMTFQTVWEDLGEWDKVRAMYRVL